MRFNSGRSLPIGIDGSDHGSCERTIRIGALVHGFPFDAINVQGADLTVGDRINIPLDVLVLRGTHEKAAQFCCAHAQQLGKLASGLSGPVTDDNILRLSLYLLFLIVHVLADVLLVHCDVIGEDRVSENHPGRIGNLTALRRDVRLRCAHRFALGREFRGLDDLQVDEAHDAHAKQENNHQENVASSSSRLIHGFALARGGRSTFNDARIQSDEACVSRGNHSLRASLSLKRGGRGNLLDSHLH